MNPCIFFTQFTIVQDSEDTIKAVMTDWCSYPTSLSVLSMQFETQGSLTLNREYVIVLMGEISQVLSDKNEELNEKCFIILI
jgi:hypothetical protein